MEQSHQLSLLTRHPRLYIKTNDSLFLQFQIVSVSEEYHTPKDLINRLPILQMDEQFDQGTGERPSSSADIRTNHFSRTNKFENRTKHEEFLVEVPYTDPKDSKLYTQPGVDPSDDQIYKVYVGSETLYCRPYQHIRRGSKLMSKLLFSISS